MVSRPFSIALIAAAVTWAGVFGAGCGRERLQSVWLDSASVASGHPDWWSVPSYEVKSLPGRFTLANDSDAVYFHLRSSNRMLAQRLRMQGLTWRLRPADNRAEELVIHYPIGMEDNPQPMQDRPPLPEGGMAAGAVFDMLARQNDEVEITGSDSLRSGRKTRDEAFQLGVGASVSEQSRAVEYTLRLTIAQIADWLKPGCRAVVEVESPAMSRERMRERGMRGERPPGGMGGRPPGGMGGGQRPGRGGGGHPGGMEPGEIGLRPDQALRLKYVIELASGPAATAEHKP